eukprot:3071106-Rhodomonas_salina.2
MKRKTKVCLTMPTSSSLTSSTCPLLHAQACQGVRKSLLPLTPQLSWTAVLRSGHPLVTRRRRREPEQQGRLTPLQPLKRRLRTAKTRVVHQSQAVRPLERFDGRGVR